MKSNTQVFLIFLIFASLAISGCGGGGGGNSATSPPTTSSPPPIPTNVTAIGERDSIRITWDASPGATNYNLYWSETPGVSSQEGNRIASTDLQVVIDELSDDITYYAVVTAENDSAESADSAEVQAQPILSLPARVSAVAANPGDGQITVEWDLQVNSDSYVVIASGAGGSTSTVTTSPFVVDGLSNGVTYSVTVAGVNDAGQGTRSAEYDATPVAPVLGWTPQTQINIPPCQNAADSNNCEFTGYARIVDAAINVQGVAAVVWTQSEGVGLPVRLAIAHSTGGAWNEQGFLADDVYFPSVALTPDGDIHVAYSGEADLDYPGLGVTYYGVPNQILWRRYRAGSWSTPIEIEGPDQNLSHLFVDLAADDLGNVFAAWVEGDWEPPANRATDTFELWVRRFDAATSSWNDAEMISESVDSISAPLISAGPANTAFVTWTQDTVPFDPAVSDPQPDRRVVYASFFDGAVWQPGTVIGRNDLVDWDDVTQLAIDTDITGSAVVAWVQEMVSTYSSPDAYQVGAARFDDRLGQWSAPELILEGSRRPIRPDVAMGAADDSIVAWHNGLNFDIASSSYDAGASLWGPVVSLPTPFLETGEEFAIESDGAGGFILAWTNWRDPDGLYVRRFEPGATDWGDSDILGGRVDSHPNMRVRAHRSGHIMIINTDTVRRDAHSFESRIYATIYAP